MLAGRNLGQHRAEPAAEELRTFSPQEVSEDISEGFSSHLRALFHPHLPRGLPPMGLADLSTLSSGVGVAAVREGSGQTLLSRHHVEPVSCNSPGGSQGQGTRARPTLRHDATAHPGF